MTDEDLDERVDALEQQVADAHGLAKQAMQYAGDAVDRAEELEDEVYELRQENERLRDQLELFKDVRQNMQRTPEERAVVLIKTLNNDALTNEELDEPALAAATMDEANAALGGGLKRQQLHEAMDRAEELVGNDDVLWKVTGDPGRGGKETKLRLNLEAGDLDSHIAGQEIRQESYGGAD